VGKGAGRDRVGCRKIGAAPCPRGDDRKLHATRGHGARSQPVRIAQARLRAFAHPTAL